MLPDFTFAFRQLVQSPDPTCIFMVTLALAMGSNSATFALINGLPLSLPDLNLAG